MLQPQPIELGIIKYQMEADLVRLTRTFESPFVKNRTDLTISKIGFQLKLLQKFAVKVKNPFQTKSAKQRSRVTG